MWLYAAPYIFGATFKIMAILYKLHLQMALRQLL